MDTKVAQKACSPLHFLLPSDLKFPKPGKLEYTVYTKSGCRHCEETHVFLPTARYVPCDVFLDLRRDDFLAFMDTISNARPRTFPMVFHNGEYVGGREEAARHVRSMHRMTEWKRKEITGELEPEPLLQETSSGCSKYVLFPLAESSQEAWRFYKMAESAFWTAEEIDLEHDRADWMKLSANEKFFLKNVLAFFAASDGIVNENLVTNFASEVQCPAARCFYGFQIAIENIHSEVYSLLIDKYVQDDSEKMQLFRALENNPAIRQKADWCLRWTDSEKASFAERLIAFAICEGIFFSGSFCAIFWLKKRGLMPGLAFSNELISRDEGMHCDFACMLYKKLINPLPEERIVEILTEAVRVETFFITKALPCSLIGMNATTMTTYIEFCADRLLLALGCAKVYNSVNPYSWMNLISLQGKTNFFEKRVSEYSKASVGQTEEDMQFSLDEDF